MHDIMEREHIQKARFAIGQLVLHQKFGYRGVVYDVDPNFQGTDEWYEANALSCPPRDRPWYRVLIDGTPVETYVAERNLCADGDRAPVSHPMLEDVFTDFRDGRYVLRMGNN